ncbi:MAG TPA: hypothetical protein VH438_03305 [Gemmatimonadales bacterium]
MPMLRVTALSIAAISGALGLACGTSYVLASRTASKAAARIAPELGKVDSDFGFHYRGAGEGEKLGWEFTYGPSGLMGPVTLELYVGLGGGLYQTQPPEALDRLKPSNSPGSN